MSERDEIRRLQSVRDQFDQSCFISFSGAKAAIDDALECMREREARARIAEQEKAELVEALRRFRHERHVHRAPAGGGDTCDLCDKDIRHDIHYRHDESAATDRAAARAILAKHEHTTPRGQ